MNNTKYFHLSTIARRFNTSTSEIVRHLKAKGFDNIKDNPRSRIHTIHLTELHDSFRQDNSSTKTLLKLSERFSDNSNQWFVGNDLATEATIENNNYTISSLSGFSSSTIEVEESRFQESERYKIETRVKFRRGGQKSFYGLIWGADEHSYQAFLINNRGQFVIGYFYNHQLELQKNGFSDSILVDEENSLGVFAKSPKEFIYYVNKQEIFKTDRVKTPGSEIGFLVQEGTAISSSLLEIQNERDNRNKKRVRKVNSSTKQASSKGRNISKKTIRTNAAYTEVRFNAKNITYKRLFEEHLRNAKKIEIYDPYLRWPHQIKNLIEFCDLIYETNKRPVELRLVTTEFLKRTNPNRGKTREEEIQTKKNNERTRQMFYELKKSLDREKRIKFTYRLKPDSAFHARKIIIDDKKTIILDRGLDIYQRYKLSGIESSRPSSRKSKGFYMIVFDKNPKK